LSGTGSPFALMIRLPTITPFGLAVGLASTSKRSPPKSSNRLA